MLLLAHKYELIKYCVCRPLLTTMLLCQLMPATVSNPTTCIAMALLSDIKRMQMIAQVSVHSWVTFLNGRNFYYAEDNKVVLNIIYLFYI